MVDENPLGALVWLGLALVVYIYEKICEHNARKQGKTLEEYLNLPDEDYD